MRCLTPAVARSGQLPCGARAAVRFVQLRSAVGRRAATVTSSCRRPRSGGLVLRCVWFWSVGGRRRSGCQAAAGGLAGVRPPPQSRPALTLPLPLPRSLRPVSARLFWCPRPAWPVRRACRPPGPLPPPGARPVRRGADWGVVPAPCAPPRPGTTNHRTVPQSQSQIQWAQNGNRQVRYIYLFIIYYYIIHLYLSLIQISELS